jgi:hypothetical protein
MTEEIRRRKTVDPEMDAIMVIAQAFSALDRDAAGRVLVWAQKRYVDPPSLDGLGVDQHESLNKFMEAITATANRVGIAKPIDLLRAMGRVADELGREEGSEA